MRSHRDTTTTDIFRQANKIKRSLFALPSYAWGNVALWDQVWDELVASDMMWYFCGWSEPIRGTLAKEFYATLYQGFPDIELLSIENAIASSLI